MSLFMAWIGFKHPDALSDYARKEFAQVIEMSRCVSRENFYRDLLNFSVKLGF